MSKTYFENGVEKTADTLQQIVKPSDMQGFTWDKLRGAFVKTTFDPNHGAYDKGDIIWLLPPDDGTLWTPPASEVTYPWVMTADHPYNLLGKAKTYQAQTQFTLKAIRLMSTKDNNTDNPLTDKSCIGSSWIVDDPYAFIEEGYNTTTGGTECSFFLRANYSKKIRMVLQRSGMTTSSENSVVLTYPISVESIADVAFKNTYITPDLRIYDTIPGITAKYTQTPNTTSVRCNLQTSVSSYLNGKTVVEFETI